MSSIEVKLPCECGGSVIALSRDAGGFVNCRCGRPVPVPNLSRLRVLSGKDAYVTNPVEAIRSIQRNGESPAGNHCLLCGSHSPAIYRCDASCETTHVKRGGGAESNDIPHLLAFFTFGWLIGSLLASRGGPRDSEVCGHDVGVSFDLPVCDACANTNGNPTKASVAKKLMLRVPAYRELLERYPDLKLTVKRTAT